MSLNCRTLKRWRRKRHRGWYVWTFLKMVNMITNRIHQSVHFPKSLKKYSQDCSKHWQDPTWVPVYRRELEKMQGSIIQELGRAILSNKRNSIWIASFEKSKKPVDRNISSRGRIKLKIRAGTETNGHEQNQNKPVMNKFSLGIRRLLTIREPKHRLSIQM